MELTGNWMLGEHPRFVFSVEFCDTDSWEYTTYAEAREKYDSLALACYPDCKYLCIDYVDRDGNYRFEHQIGLEYECAKEER